MTDELSQRIERLQRSERRWKWIALVMAAALALLLIGAGTTSMLLAMKAREQALRAEQLLAEADVAGRTGLRETPGGTNNAKDDNQEGSITVEADGLTQEQKKVVAAAFKQILSDAIGSAIQKGLVEAYEKLGIADKVEAELISALPKVGEAGPGDGLMCIYLIRPGKATDGPSTTVLLVDDKPFIRLTRAVAAVQRPMAVITVTAVVNGQPSLSEWFLAHDAEGQWKKQRPTVRTERMK